MTHDGSRPADASASTPDWEAVARFLAGESSAEESARVERWFAAHPGDAALVAKLDASLEGVAAAAVDVEGALARVHQRMERAGGAPRLAVVANTGRRRYAWPAVGLLAAAVLLFAFVSLRRAPNATAPSRTYATETGQRDSALLADGSRVILGPRSRLTVPGDYGATARSVELTGDAYFDVRHDAAKPFSVRVANAIVEDIGTAFTIESDAHDTTTVSVMAGSVRLRATNGAATATLAAGDRGSLTASGNVRADRAAVVPDDSAWTRGVLVFRDASIRRVAGELRRWYGVDLSVADSSLLNQPLTATFRGNDPVDQVLRNIALAVGGRVERQGGSATLFSSSGSAIRR